MSPHNQTPVPPPGYGSGEPVISLQQVYDELMGQIEPDLTSGMVGHLDEIYAEETPEERQLRFKRYAKAFETFDIALNELVTMWQDELLEFRAQLMGSYEAKIKNAHSSDSDA